MFTFNRGLLDPPDTESLEQARQAVLVNKTVRLRAYNSIHFDLTNLKENKKFSKLMMKLHNGMQAKTHQIVAYDIQFVPTGLQNGPGHLVHIQWVEFELVETPTAPIVSSSGSPDGE
jgi:hypothetical protein